MRRLVLAAAALCAGVLAATGSLLAPLHAGAAAPSAQAWWNLQNTGLLAPPAPAGVNPGDLFAEGAAGDRKAPAAPPAPFADVGSKGGADAISALRFEVPSGALVERLTLHYDGNPPASPDVLACRTTAGFKPVDNGPWSDVPPYDCTKPVIGSLGEDGKSLVFADIGALANGTSLSFVLVAQYYDREVWAKPGADALKIRDPLPNFSFGHTASEPPPSDTAGTASSPAAAEAPPAVYQAPPVPVFPPTDAVVRRAPQVAASQPVSRRPTVPALAVAGRDDARARLAAGAFLIVALLVFALLTAADNLFMRRMLGMRLATAAAGPPGARSRGLGRFRKPRSGRPDSV